MKERWFGPVIAILVIGLASGALWFIASGMGGLSENLVYYWSPTELVQAGDKAYAATVRLGGMVEPGSMDWDADNQRLAFRVTDGANTIPVYCKGAPPQMLR
ncbi:MAG: cytochrome c maturation protein CcmE, partial [Deltaproteobacteria bacterium]|nr:cytochrome c maturation protein CcmE [Deltaproteobacteria bacterium]